MSHTNCSVYLCKKTLVFVPEVFAHDIGSVLMDPAIFCPHDQVDQVMGKAFLACFSMSYVCESLGDSFDPMKIPFFATLLGYKNLNALEESAKLVIASTKNRQIMLTPTSRNMTQEGGYLHRPDDSIVVDRDAGDDAIGRAVKSAMRKS